MTCDLLPFYHYLNPPDSLHLLLPSLYWSVLPPLLCQSKFFPVPSILQTIVHILFSRVFQISPFGTNSSSSMVSWPFYCTFVRSLKCLRFAYQCLCSYPALACQQYRQWLFYSSFNLSPLGAERVSDVPQITELPNGGAEVSK